MMKICQNCHTENPVNAVFCSQCGMSLLTRAPRREEAEVQDTTDPTAKRMRRIARMLALIWAVCWTVASAAALLAEVYLCLNEGRESENFACVVWVLMLLIVGFIFLLTWVPTAIAWRWETVGGVMLVVIGLLSGAPNLLNSIWTPVWARPSSAASAFAVLFFSGPPLAAGSLLLASRRRSKTTAGFQGLAGRRKWYAAIASVAMLSLVILVLVARFLGLRDVSPPGPLLVDVSPPGPLLVIDLSPSISAEGRYVAFASLATDLVPGDTNDYADVFVHDQQTGDTFLVSVASNGTQGNGDSIGPSISADGRYVAFESSATQLVPGDTNIVDDIFVHDRQTGDTFLVSVASNGTQGNGYCIGGPSISADGRYVAFESSATQLVPGDTNQEQDIFVHDRQTGQTERVSVASDGEQGNGFCASPSISADGRHVAFDSWASDFVPGDTNDEYDVFVHDRHTGQTARVSVASDGTQGNDWCGSPSISADGRYTAFMSDASNLVAADLNDSRDIFLHDRQTGETVRVSVASDGTQGNGDSFEPSISPDGRYVAFRSDAGNLVPGDANDIEDIFVHDRQTGETVRVSVGSDGTEGDGDADEPSISTDGRYVAFDSWAGNLVPGDTNDDEDIFVHDRETGETVRVSVASQGSQTD